MGLEGEGGFRMLGKSRSETSTGITGVVWDTTRDGETCLRCKAPAYFWHFFVPCQEPNYYQSHVQHSMPESSCSTTVRSIHTVWTHFTHRGFDCFVFVILYNLLFMFSLFLYSLIYQQKATVYLIFANVNFLFHTIVHHDMTQNFRQPKLRPSRSGYDFAHPGGEPRRADLKGDDSHLCESWTRWYCHWEKKYICWKHMDFNSQFFDRQYVLPLGNIWKQKHMDFAIKKLAVSCKISHPTLGWTRGISGISWIHTPRLEICHWSTSATECWELCFNWVGCHQWTWAFPCLKWQWNIRIELTKHVEQPQSKLMQSRLVSGMQFCTQIFTTDSAQWNLNVLEIKRGFGAFVVEVIKGSLEVLTSDYTESCR